jgi:Tfp pilus assembly protein PilF
MIADQDGDQKNGMELLKAVVRRQPDHARAHIALGLEYRSLGLLTEARGELEAAVHLNPDSQKAHYQLALVLTALKESASAKAEFDIASRLRASSDGKVSWILASSSTGATHAADKNGN